MAFAPLPTSFAKFFSANDNPEHGTVLELGVGQGCFRAGLPDSSRTYWGLDSRPRTAGTVCDLVGDARRPPVRPGSISLLIAANLVRHLVPRYRVSDCIALWRGLLAPTGRLFIFEDEPHRATAPGRNFYDLQGLLARLIPESRGGLLSCDRFRELAGVSCDCSEWTFGSSRNETQLDARAVMTFLAQGKGATEGEVARLVKAIGRQGIAPVRYWWAEVGPKEVV